MESGKSRSADLVNHFPWGVPMLRSYWSWIVLTQTFFLATHVSTSRAAVQYPKQPTDTTVIEKMRSGTISVGSNAKNKELLGDLAKWLSWRLAFPPYNGEEPKTKIPGPPESLDILLDEGERKFSWPNPKQPPNENQLEYAQELGKAMDEELMYVIEESVSKKIVRVNAARMLAHAAKMPYAGFADTFLKIIKQEKYGPELKLFAFQGLHNLLAISEPRDPTRHFIKDHAKLAEICKTLDEIITHQYPKGFTQDAALVVQFIRREAVRAMAQFKHSVIRNNRNMPLAKPIWTLVRVASNDRVVSPDKAALPDFGFHPLERIEAVIGICTMQPDKTENIDAVVYVVNEAFLELGTWHETEKAQFQKDPRNKPIVPWKITASRLTEALKTWKAQTANLPATRNPSYVSNFTEQAIQKSLAKIEAAGVEAVPDNRPFSTWRNDRKPKVAQILSDDPETVLPLQ